MPATSVELDDEILSLLGKLPQALRAAEKEVAKLEKQIADAARKGEQVSPEKLQRAAELRARAAGYREAVDTEKRLKALEKQAKALEPDGGGEPPSSEPRKTTKRPPLSESAWDWLKGAGGRQRRGGFDADAEAFRGIRGALNTHNPHGTIRNVLAGNFGFNNVTSLMSKLGVASAVGAVAIAGVTAGFKFAEMQEEIRAEATKITMADQSERTRIAMLFRHGGASEGAKEFLKGLGKADASGIKAAYEASGVGFVGNTFFGSQAPKIQSYQQKVKLFNALTGGKISIDPRAFVNDPTVQYQMYGPGGPWTAISRGLHWLKNHTYGAITGAHAREENELSMKRGEQIVASEMKKREIATEEYFRQDPNRTVARVDMENRTSALRQWQMERFTDWNSY
jgi:hypothetical protein